MKKNILFITADQWRGDCLSALGHPDVKTPHFDELISEGMTFKNHYSVCAPCAPARASLLTGMYLQNHRVTRNGTPLDHRHTNIAKELRKAGYSPKLFGYTDTALDPRHHSSEEVLQYGYEGLMPGFEEGLLLPGDQPDVWLKWLSSLGYNYKNVDEALSPVETVTDRPGTEEKSDLTRPVGPAGYKAEHSQTAFLTQKVIDYIQNTTDNWCVHLSYYRPHPPFYAPRPYDEMYDPDLIESVNYCYSSEDEHPWLMAARGPLGDWPASVKWWSITNGSLDRITREIRAAYYGLISKVDFYFGQLIDHLKRSGEYNSTLIIVTSDHGELLGDHGLFGKRGFHKESYHIPLIIRDPQHNNHPGHIEDALTESVDIMPTILDWVGSSIPRQCDGHSLLPLIRGAKPDNWRKELHCEYDFRDVKSQELERILDVDMDDCQLNVISNDDYMYVHFTSLPPLFYDLRNDPDAMYNVVEKPEYTRLVLEFSQRLLSWRMHNDERVLTNFSISREEIYQRH